MSDPHRPVDPSELHGWLTDAGLASMSMRNLFDGLCRRLVAAGLPLTRGYLSPAALHPLFWATGVTWHSGRVAEADITYGYETSAAWLASPFRRMLETGTRRLRRRLAGEDALLDFPVLSEFRDAGLTDWLALFYPFGWAVEHAEVDELGVIVSWATNRSEGWTEADLAILEEVSRTLALAVRGSSSRDTTRDLLATYLGRDAAERVVAGHVQRGSVGRNQAVILCADLSGFTDFAETAAPEEVTRRLNAYFDCMGAPVTSAGGEILKFLGDGLLAVFLPDAGGDADMLAAAVLTASLDILARCDRLNAAERRAGHPVLAVDLALHEGEVIYGNVGTADRLDFTVIGPAVNEVTRIEALCKELGCHLLVSDSFVRAAPAVRPHLRSLGRHRLRGVRDPRELFTSL